MNRSPVCLLIAAGLVPLACADSGPDGLVDAGRAGATNVADRAGAPSGSAGSGAAAQGGGAGMAASTLSTAGSGGEPDAGPADASTQMPPHHLGKPFTIVDGKIRADSNEFGLAASFYAINDPADPAIEVTRTTGSICVRGSLHRVVQGDVARYWGITFGFITVPDEFVTLSADALSLSPEAPPWDLGAGRVLGIAATVTGAVLPNAASFGLSATPGGQDPAGLYGVDQTHTIFGDCSAPRITASGQVTQSLFHDLQDFWCLPQYMSAWTAHSASLLFWGLNSLIVDSDAGTGVSDAYDFCLSEIRPIVLGAGPDELVDAGVDGGAPP